MRDRLNGLRYFILPGKLAPDSPHLPIYNQVYKYWKDFWYQEYAKVGSEGKLLPEDFQRQSFITCLMSGDKVAGLHFYSVFDLAQIINRDLHYFAFYDDMFMHHLKSQGVKNVMSFEFFTVDPEWRKEILGISLAPILAGCGMKILQGSGIDAAITTARKDVGAHKVAYALGWECVQKDRVQRNYVCDMLMCFPDKVTEFPDSEIVSLTDRFWSQRQDFTRMTYDSAPLNIFRKKAA